MKICFVASSGGHWEELISLKEIIEENNAFFVTENGGQVKDSQIQNCYIIPQINRHERHFFKNFLKIFKSAYSILKKEQPKAVITTGALVAFPFCVIGKLMRKKIIYIESFARVNEKSLTGKLVYPFADLFLVQWESMLKLYPKAKYVGGVF